MFNHIGFDVDDIQKSKRFYLAALAPLGYGLLAQGENGRWSGTRADVFGLAHQDQRRAHFTLPSLQKRALK